MPRDFLQARTRFIFLVVSMLGWLSAQAQTQSNATCNNPPSQTALLSEVHSVADPTRAVPLECTFSVSVAGTYQVSLSDLGVVPGSNPATPAPLASVKLAVTSGSAIVGTPTELDAPGSLQINAQVGTYVIHVVGLPGPQFGSGPVGIQVTNVADSSVLASFSANLALPAAGPPSTQASLDDSFTVASDGSYIVTLSDLQVPHALSAATLILVTATGTVVTTSPLTGPGSTTVALQQGVTYRIFALAQADSTAAAGLFSATVAPSGGGAPVYSKVVPVGSVTAVGTVSLNAGTAYTLQLTDLSIPAALSSVGAVATNGGQIVAQLNAAGTSAPFNAVAGPYQVFAAATAATNGTTSTGSYAVALSPSSGAPALSAARAVGSPGTTGPIGYSFDTTVSTAGSYSFNLADFAFPMSFTSLTAVVVQGGAALGPPLTLQGTQTVNASTGPLSVLVFAQPNSKGSLFGVDLTGGSGAAPIFATTQGAGALFSSRQIVITSAGTYAVSLSDVGFPAPLASLAVIVTNGSNHVGSIFGAGTFNFQAAPGTYLVNFIAQPSGTDEAGTYSLAAAVAPVVTLTSNVASVESGNSVVLNWTSQNATSCTASDGWTGNQPLQGTNFTTAPLTATTTFTLTCSGENTTASASAKVTVNPAPAKSGGGGGALDALSILILLFGLTMGRSYIRHGS